MAKRVDANQASIVAALRKVGATVQHLHKLGEGCPDIAVGFRGRNYLMEIKMPKGELNKDQETWHQHWRGQVAVVRSAEDALRVIQSKDHGLDSDYPETRPLYEQEGC